MSEVTETGVDTAQSDEEAMASLMAGYNARGANTPPVDVPDDTTAQPETPANNVPHDAPQGDEQATPPVAEAEPVKDAATLMREQLAAFKEEVRTIVGDPTAVRKLHGEIGDINRKLKQLEPKAVPAPAPVNEELAAAMEGAERVAEEFQELGGPLVTAMKAMAKANATPQASGPTQEEISAQIEARARQLQQETEQRQHHDAVKVLKIDHPDFDNVMRSQEFDTWVKAKPVDLQETIRYTENPLLAARFLSEFKETQRTQQKKQDRLSRAVTPQGVAIVSAAPSKLTPDEEVMLGYQKSGPRPLHKR